MIAKTLKSLVSIPCGQHYREQVILHAELLLANVKSDASKEALGKLTRITDRHSVQFCRRGIEEAFDAVMGELI